MLELVCVKMSR